MASSSERSSSKRALLIASPIHGLRGPLNDVETIARVLERQSFQIIRCCGPNATRDGILTAWRNLIDTSTTGDAVTIYYSGHGGLVKSSEPDTDIHRPLQFILPFDYDESTDDDFRGILEIELSHLLLETTEKTDNVTIILDCCHAGRMARHPRHGRRANPKQIADVQYSNLRQHITRLRQSGHFARELDPLGNPDAVRVMAAAATETAWECEGPDGEWTGALTDALASAIDAAGQRQVSWRSTLLRVNELVHVQFPQQHPVAEGPDTRLLFATQRIASSAVLLQMQGDVAVLQSGYVSGVRKGDVYVLMPAGHEVPDARFRIGEATVTAVNGFKARVTLDLDSPGEATHAGPSRVTEVAASSSNSIPAGEVTSTTTPTNPCTEEDVTNKPNSSDVDTSVWKRAVKQNLIVGLFSFVVLRVLFGHNLVIWFGLSMVLVHLTFTILLILCSNRGRIGNQAL
ncbi:hypothetical protein BO86DRAFT_386889 [Aspergillus japonicus CBS 114.51]|uniref:Peptidase C14 caspase domain-containing protein n=1 Tax=Aspergillus japonicus CBS 114.51 TaxID=1448312 RepID=A0A8T8X9R3_ASPJA|nr:hypothetical protein BO86DRAFT_386889 [Aspergillus japonicus CBS 114.51]RAH84821.1 hypothetical protein BO86DRAFT_386889 [Aspergillus japonicus CBS 114.51]